MAALEGRKKMAKKLLESGADKNKKDHVSFCFLQLLYSNMHAILLCTACVLFVGIIERSDTITSGSNEGCLEDSESSL